MAGMMLLNNDINFGDIKDVKEPTDHRTKEQNKCCIDCHVFIVVFVVYIGAHVPRQYFYKRIQYIISVPMSIRGTESLKSVPRIRPWNSF